MLPRTILAGTALVLAFATAHAGDVQAIIQNGDLRLTTSNGSDQATVDQMGLAAKQIRVTPSGATTVNGGGSAVVLNGFKGDVRIVHTSGGTTAITLVGPLTVKGGVDAQAGAAGSLNLQLDVCDVKQDVRMASNGAAVILFLVESIVRDDVVVDGAGGDDSFQLAQDSQVGGNATIDLGDGLNAFIVSESAVHGGMKYRGGSGDESPLLSESLVRGKVSFALGDGTGSLQLIDSTLEKSLKVNGGAGNDTLTLNSTHVGGSVKVKLEQAGAVNVNNSLIDGNLVATGGSGAETVSVTNHARIEGNCRLSLADGSNGISVHTSSVGGDLRIDDSSGINSLTLTDCEVGDDLLAEYDGGTNAVLLTDVSVLGTSLVATGGGDDSVGVLACVLPGTLRARLGDGNNGLTVAASSQLGKLDAKGGGGADAVTVDEVLIAGDLVAKLGSGNNTLIIDGTAIGDDLIVRTGSGDDTVTFSGTLTIFGDVDIDGGGGNDTLP